MAVFQVTNLSPFGVFASAENDIVSTGDRSVQWVWSLLASVSGVGIVTLAVLNKRKKTQQCI